MYVSFTRGSGENENLMAADFFPFFFTWQLLIQTAVWGVAGLREVNHRLFCQKRLSLHKEECPSHMTFTPQSFSRNLLSQRNIFPSPDTLPVEREGIFPILKVIFSFQTKSERARTQKQHFFQAPKTRKKNLSFLLLLLPRRRQRWRLKKVKAGSALFRGGEGKGGGRERERRRAFFKGAPTSYTGHQRASKQKFS